MKILRERGQLDRVQLTIAGSGHPSHEQQLHAMVEDFNLGAHVQFLGRVNRSEMPEVLRQHKVLVLPSKWDEPFSLVMQEAMASGMAVIGTPTGGTGELLVHRKTGLTFPAGSANVLASRVSELAQNPDVLARLADRGRKTVLQKFSIRSAVDEIETHLSAAAN